MAVLMVSKSHKLLYIYIYIIYKLYINYYLYLHTVLFPLKASSKCDFIAVRLQRHKQGAMLNRQSGWVVVNEKHAFSEHEQKLLLYLVQYTKEQCSPWRLETGALRSSKCLCLSIPHIHGIMMDGLWLGRWISLKAFGHRNCVFHIIDVFWQADWAIDFIPYAPHIWI